MEIVDHQSNLIVAEKILGDRTNIYVDGNLNPSLKISGVLKKPLYFGQKDLSNIKGSNSIESLINQLIGEKVKNHRQKIEGKNTEVLNLLSDITRQNKSLAQKPDLESKKAALEHNLKVFKDNEIDKKLNRQIEFDKDANRFKNLKEFEQLLRMLQSSGNLAADEEPVANSTYNDINITFFKKFVQMKTGKSYDAIDQSLPQIQIIWVLLKMINSLSLAYYYSEKNLRHSSLFFLCNASHL